MIECYEASCEVIQELKKNKKLQATWNFLDENEGLFVYEKDNEICAAIRMSEDPYEKWIWIDEFEVIKEFQNRGIGKNIISGILAEGDEIIKLVAKDESVAEFWHKCGFEYDVLDTDEILMYYNPSNC